LSFSDVKLLQDVACQKVLKSTNFHRVIQQ